MRSSDASHYTISFHLSGHVALFTFVLFSSMYAFVLVDHAWLASHNVHLILVVAVCIR